MLVHLKEILEKAKKENYAIGAFNTSNLEVTLGIVQAAVAKKAPIIIQVSETAIQYAGLKPITHIVETIAKNEAVKIPIALHLDHGKSFHSITECIEAGFSSIMIDASDLAFDENISLTKKAVDYAHKKGVLAQGELGEVIRGRRGVVNQLEREIGMTDPKEAEEFVKKTNVDTLAVAIGNVHGIWKLQLGVPKLDIERLKEICKRVKIPLVLHGASGLKKEEINEAIKFGIRIVNIDTEIRLAFINSLRKVLEQNGQEYDPRKILVPAIKAVQQLVEEKIEMFGSANKG